MNVFYHILNVFFSNRFKIYMQITSIWLVHHTDNKWSTNFDERPHRSGRPQNSHFSDRIGSRVMCTWFFFAHPSPHPKRHLDRFIRFCSAHGCVQQTDTHTDSALHPQQQPAFGHCAHAMRPNNGQIWNESVPKIIIK